MKVFMLKFSLRLISLLFMLLYFYPNPCWSAEENLDEIFARKSRQSSATFYSGEDHDNYYIWQPMTLCYTDVITGHEVWRMSSANILPDPGFIWYCDITHGPWNADGKRLVIISTITTDAYMKDPYTDESSRMLFLVKTDGTFMRPIINGPKRSQWDSQNPFAVQWSPILPEVYYDLGGTGNENFGVSERVIYKCTVTDVNETKESWITLPSADYITYYFDNGISPDGKIGLVIRNYHDGEYKHWLYPVQLYPDDSRGLLDSNGYSYNRPHSTYWGHMPSSINTQHGHGLELLGPDGEWYTTCPEDTHGCQLHYKLLGTHNDGGAGYIEDTTCDENGDYDWGGEAFVVSTIRNDEAGPDPWRDCSSGNNEYPGYVNHSANDRWGRYILYGHYNALGEKEPGPGIWDWKARKFSIFTFGGGFEHADWHAWSDWCIATTEGNHITDKIRTMKYNDASSVVDVCYTHVRYSGGEGNYYTLPRPGQSPDGTKVAFGGNLLNNDAASMDIFWAVAYYPYPPEITSVSASGGTVTVRFDWRLDQRNSRGYTKRGWPNEDNDNPPPPRETEKFRLWRSKDKNGWIPIKTVDADIFTKFDFPTGNRWHSGQTSYWEITDTPGDGTFYYAVTAVEHSGLESHTLSNIYKIGLSDGSGSGSEDTAYPSNPGGDSGFYTMPPSPPIDVLQIHKKSPASSNGQYTINWKRPADYEIIRYYNIYAKDGEAPKAIQQNRIASIFVRAAQNGSFSWVDWLGNSNGSTRYMVTSVDYQGNESAGVADPNYESDTQYRLSPPSNFRIVEVEE